jgi:hypothetical protein
MNLEYFRRISDKTQTSDFMKIHPVGTKTLHADRQKDGQTDMTKLIVAFRIFVTAPKNFLPLLGIKPHFLGF